MKVHLIKRQTIENYAIANAGSRASFAIWIQLMKYADWQTPEDIKKTFGSADLLLNGSNRVIFDIAGNKYRMICKYVFGHNEVHLFVCWIGTHAEYDLICARGTQFTINVY